MKEDTHAKQISSLPSSDSEEQRKIAEGADALLNLAGISTRKRTQSTTLYPPGKIKEICVIIINFFPYSFFLFWSSIPKPIVLISVSAFGIFCLLPCSEIFF
jgi:hypothetical protein